MFIILILGEIDSPKTESLSDRYELPEETIDHMLELRKKYDPKESKFNVEDYVAFDDLKVNCVVFRLFMN